MRRRHLKLVAVVALVVLALSGFSPAKSTGGSGSKSKGSSSKSSGGGGCGKDTKRSGSIKKGRSSTGGTTGGGGRTSPVTHVIECVMRGESSAKVRITAPSGGPRTYTLRMEFLDGLDDVLTTGRSTVSLKGNETKTVRIPMAVRSLADEVDDCSLQPVR